MRKQIIGPMGAEHGVGALQYIEHTDRTEVVTGDLRTVFAGHNQAAARQISVLHHTIHRLETDQTRPIKMTTYPQLARMNSVQAESRAISEFLQWLDTEGIALARPDKSTPALPDCWHLPIHESREGLLARFFGVDLQAAEREKRAMLAKHAREQC